MRYSLIYGLREALVRNFSVYGIREALVRNFPVHRVEEALGFFFPFIPISGSIVPNTQVIEI